MGSENMKLSLALLAGAFAEKVDYTGHAVYRLKDVTVGQIASLKAMDMAHNLDFWVPENVEEIEAGMKVDVRVPSESVAELKNYFTESEFNYEIFIEDLQNAIDNEIDMEELQTYGEYAYDFFKYHSIDEINGLMVDVAENTENAKVVNTGNSFEKRDIWAIEIGPQDAEKVIVVDCGIHAREWISPAYCQWLIKQLSSGDFVDYTSDILWSVTPVLNPDGYEYSRNSDRMWRKNRDTSNGRCIGVDLNRNYDAKHAGAGASSQPCAETYCGPSAFSEPESAAQRDYMERFVSAGTIKSYLTMHSYGQVMLYPYSYDRISKPENKDELQNLGNAMRAATLSVD